MLVSTPTGHSSNMDYASLLGCKTYGLNKDRRGRILVVNVRQLLSRYLWNVCPMRFGENSEFSYLTTHPNTVTILNWFTTMVLVLDFFKRLDEIITKGVYVTYEGKTIDLRKPEAIEYIGSIMQGNVDTFDKYFFKYWYMFAHMYFGDVDQHD
ncbi:Arylphorin subunit A4 [Lucilia cuprina]|nr:Arylphorin subunit A4 [Lucilia cuprina]